MWTQADCTNPTNPQQLFVHYDLQGAFVCGLRCHPQKAIQATALMLDAKVLDAIPQSIADSWWVWLEFRGPVPDLKLPYIGPGRCWIAPGTP